ncbi:helix-turn-helix domain protein [Emticicia oligotrophica DSM 17448]|uniref:Helix-turn-helix domain protein n=1 Tax=Emticicia oligotrophica (strain DSM 17448 / CIP 109782 / MTCC 6937 / GPTSA100-15) TaxID=929562 RepID=A0ABM5N0I9_EMTOG|nr:helix-turn-helix transcriptional regulator [Emticicia oligotrophica]AFK02897.1 helix-turn-helix domain protein [Emticicia oligotrophica DSM 17448]
MALLDNLLAEITPEEQARTDRKMRIASIIADTLVEKGMAKKDFAQKVGRKPSEITKWLSGRHNFTLDTLTDIEQVLKIKLITDKRKAAAQKQVLGGLRA